MVLLQVGEAFLAATELPGAESQIQAAARNLAWALADGRDATALQVNRESHLSANREMPVARARVS
jgi:hypothetical protein